MPQRVETKSNTVPEDSTDGDLPSEPGRADMASSTEAQGHVGEFFSSGGRSAAKSPVGVKPLTNDRLKGLVVGQEDAPACDICGSLTVRNGNCYKCLNCGSSLGCS